MRLSTTAQNDHATLIARWVRANTIGYSAVATKVGQSSHRDAAVVAIIPTGSTTCTAKVAVHRDRIVYVSKLATHISYPTDSKDVGRITGAFLYPEGN